MMNLYEAPGYEKPRAMKAEGRAKKSKCNSFFAARGRTCWEMKGRECRKEVAVGVTGCEVRGKPESTLQDEKRAVIVGKSVKRMAQCRDGERLAMR